MIAEMIKERNLPEFRSCEEMIDMLLKDEYGYFLDIPCEISVSDPKNMEVRYCDRKGPHFLSRHDWQKYMAYIRKHMDD